MSEDEPVREPGHEPSGVVEALREEIEEVVEHVPQPVRWTVAKLARLVLLVFAGLVVLAVISAVLFFMNRTELVARELSILLNRTLREHSDLVLDLRDIRGNPFTGFRAVEPRVRYRDGATLLAAREMRVDYSAWGLLFGRAGEVEVTLDRPEIRLVAANGSWRVPVWRSNPSRKGHGKARELQVHLRIRDAHVLAPVPYGRAEGLGLELTADLGAQTRARLERMAWTKGPWDSKLEAFTADLTADSSGVRARIEQLRTGDLDLHAEAGWRAGEGQRHVHVVMGRVRWGWLAKVFDNGTFDVPGEGAFVLDADGGPRPGEWGGRFRGTIEWNGLPVEGSGLAHWSQGELRVDSLLASSDAGDLNGSFTWSHAGWQIGGEARGADPAHWHALHLDGWPSGDLNGRFRFTEDTRAAKSGVLEAQLAASQWQGWRADSAVVRVDIPASAPDSFRVTGVRRGGRFTLRGRSEKGGGWSGPYTVRELPLEEWPDGRATGLRGVLEHAEGTVESRGGALFVTGDLAGRDTHWSSAAFSNWSLAGVRGRLLPTPELTAQATTGDGFFLGIHLDKATAPIALGDQVVRFLPLTAEAGDTTVTITGQAAWNGDTWWMTLSSAELSSAQFHFRAEPPVRLSGDASGVLFEQLAADDRGAHVEARGRWAAPGGPYDFEFVGQRLDLSRIGMPADLEMAGRADVRLTVHGRSGDPSWRFEGRAGAPALGGHRADSLSIVLAGGPRRLELEDGRFVLGGGSVRAAGAVERTVAEFPDSLSATAILRWLRDAASWRGQATMNGMPVAPFANARIAGPVPAGGSLPAHPGWDGRVSGRVSLSGDPQHPIADLDLQAEGFGWRDIRAERVDLGGHYEAGVLDVRQLRARMLNVESSASVRLPLELALGRPVRVPEAPLSGQVNIPAGDLRVLPLIVPQLQSARGSFNLQARLAGTPRALQLGGTGQIRGGVVRPINRSEVFQDLRADLHFDQRQITLDTLSATQSGTGRVTAHGNVQLDRGHLQSYRFAVSVRDLAAAEEGLYAVLFDGDFVVSDGARVGGEVLPEVAGQARLKRGVIEFDFANQTEVQKRAATTQPLYWTYRIQVGATKDLRWRTQDADMEFDADLDLQQTPDSLLIYGEMRALRGSYQFLSTAFRIRSADITFDNQQGVDPLLDILADARVPLVVDPTKNDTRLETVTATLAGRSSQPVITLTSSSNADQKTIFDGLTLGLMGNAGGTGALLNRAGNVADSYLARQLNAQLDAGLREYFKGALTNWELRRDQGSLVTGQGATYFGVTAPVSDKIAIRYQQRLYGQSTDPSKSHLDPSDLFEQNVEAEYRVNRFIYLTSGVSRRRIGTTNVAQPTTDYNVNLKARWEY